MTDSTPQDHTRPDPLPGARFAVRTEVMFWEGVLEFLLQNLEVDPEATVQQAVAAASMQLRDVQDELQGMVQGATAYESLVAYHIRNAKAAPTADEIIRQATREE